MAEMLLPLPCYLRVKDSSLILILYLRIGFSVGQKFFGNAHWKEHYQKNTYLKNHASFGFHILVRKRQRFYLN